MVSNKADLPLEERKKLFVEEAIKVSVAVYEMMSLWEDQDLSDLLHGSPSIMKAYPLTISFDDWWYEWANYREVLEEVLLKGKERIENA